MRILVSFCNVEVPLSPRLALIDPATSAVTVPRVPERLLRSGGLSGLHQCERFLYVIAQTVGLREGGTQRPSVLFVLDRHDLSLRGAHRFEHAVEVHSFLAEGQKAWAASTGTDEVIELTFSGSHVTSERIVWRPDPAGPREDRHHVNSLCRFEGRLLVSGFGVKAGAGWATARDGFVYDLESGEYLRSDIAHPHSLFPRAGGLLCCESREKVVRSVDGDHTSAPFSGYTRGLCEHDDCLFVGISRGRLISRSTSEAKRAALPPTVGSCGVWRLSGHAWQPEAAIDLSDIGPEIYDLMPVSGTDAWPLVPESEWRTQALRHLWATLDRTQFRASIAERAQRERRAGAAGGGQTASYAG